MGAGNGSGDMTANQKARELSLAGQILLTLTFSLVQLKTGLQRIIERNGLVLDDTNLNVISPLSGRFLSVKSPNLL